MKLRLQSWWFAVSSSYWFLPALMALGAVALSTGTVALDRELSQWGFDPEWVYTGGPAGARAILATVAGSMITVAGVTFSITMVALSLASSQFGPRLLNNFMRDTGNQVVLGTYTATFLYCLLVLRTVRTDAEPFVPNLSVSVALALAVAGLGVLIYFIHHAATSIQAEDVIGDAGHDLDAAIDRLFPQALGAEPEQGAQPRVDQPADWDESAAAVPIDAAGYIRAIDTDGILALAVAHDAVFRLRARPGRFLVPGDAPLAVWPAERLDDALRTAVRGVFSLGPRRTPEQDVEFAMLQLIEVALRALSPGINDPFTALAVLDRLEASLCRLAARALPSPCRLDDEGRLRVVTEPVGLDLLVIQLGAMLRPAAATHRQVAVRMLDLCAGVGARATREADRNALRDEAEALYSQASATHAEPIDRAALEAADRRALAAIRRDRP